MVDKILHGYKLNYYRNNRLILKRKKKAQIDATLTGFS